MCDLLDKHPDLRRSFPEILSLRDLDVLLAEAVSRSILERSRAAVEESRDLVPVFVPTVAYHNAWTSLRNYSFVVLDGPPEMGKTAIARTIALAHLLNDWQAVDCRGPDDFFEVFTDKRRQIFVADDAFGRTEYDPVLGRVWERDLPRVFHCLDNRHRLIWTTRKHILIRALREMDLTGRAQRFPEPGEVIVTADNLSIEEKARILYRHSRAARLEGSLRDVVRRNSVVIVKDEHFTPERIRRFVRDLIPELAKGVDNGSLTTSEITSHIREAIHNPTERMRKSYQKLPDVHKWILFVFLECDGPATLDVLKKYFERHRPGQVGFAEAVDDLIGTFLKVGYGQYRWMGKLINWIHPSYRDLVIDELSSDIGLQLEFLERLSTSGVKLALSYAGGSVGERKLPFMQSMDSWNILERRCSEIVQQEDEKEAAKLIDIVLNAKKAVDGQLDFARNRMQIILRAICQATARTWDVRGGPHDLFAIKSYVEAVRHLDPPPSLPGIASTWEYHSKAVREDMSRGYVSEPVKAWRWNDLSDVIQEFYPTLANSDNFKDTCGEIKERLFELAEEEAQNGAYLQDPETNESEGRRLEELAEFLSGIDPEGQRDTVITSLFGIAQEYKENGPPEEDSDYEQVGGGDDKEDFDIEALFDDL